MTDTILGSWTSAYAGSKLDLTGYHLNFEDNFNALSVGGSTAAPDTATWFASVHAPFGSATFATPSSPVSPYSVSNSALTIEMSQVNGQWQSGYMQTVNAASQGYQQQYGYFEMSAKFPAGAGSWPAFWLLSSDTTKTRVEIDTIEAYGTDLKGNHAALHFTPGPDGALSQKVDTSDYTTVTQSMFDGNFHTYGALVRPDFITFYYDGVELERFPSSPLVATPLYMAVDLAMNPNEVTQASGAYDMVIDYVRAYADPSLTPLVLNGTDANDSLQGLGFSDTINGGAGADTMAGGAGDDTYYVDNTGDVVIEAPGGGVDTVISSVSFSGADQDIEIVRLTGTGNTTVTGNAQANQLFGNSGANTLDGGAGADTMTGGAGDDTYYVDNAGDKVIEAAGGGTDTVFSSVSFSTAGQYIENVHLTGTANINATGNSLANQLFGNSGNNVLNGASGSDTMTGGAGDDTYYVDVSSDVVVEAANGGNDTIVAGFSYNLQKVANVENLTLTGTANYNGTGNSLNNHLLGNSGANILVGSDGADTLDGGAGNDTLYGGVGKDVFVFDTPLNASSNVDAIKDFVVADDKINLDHNIFSTLVTGALPSGSFVVGTKALQADDHIIYNKSTGELFYDPDGSGAAAQIKFAQLSANLSLTSAHFVVI
jgi:Ca2+-binding RTX toxin-like protein